ncbi:MAG TPA: DsbA family protein [Polyangiaceae bacterium]|nr:DsbA family protein [Polyangiaceae bacterium]HMR76416.1 DsbA family protein [Polyangiaceae bacterium]
MSHHPVSVQYFSDVLCAWAYVGQARLNELESAFGDEVVTDCHFMTVFGDARGKLESRWRDRGGLAGYAAHVRGVVAQFNHVQIHPHAWEKVVPTSSLGCHIFLAAVKLYDAEMFRKAAWAVRVAFFQDGVDISKRKAQLEVADSIGLPVGKIEDLLYTGQAHAELSRGLDLAKRYSIEVSPTFVFNEGRQRLNGNVGYRVIEANVRELLREPRDGQSWC